MKKLLFLFTLSLLLVSMAWGQVYLINEGFESTTFPPTGWTNSTNGAIRTTNNPRTGSACMGFNGVNDAIYTPQLSNPNQLSFWYRRSSNTTAWTLNVQVSTDAENWASIGTITNATTTYQKFTSDLSSYSNIYIRLLDQRSTGTPERYVDDFTVTAVASTPAINVSTPTLPGFTYVVDEGPSDEQNFTVSGSNLTANISISAPTNYEISTGTGATFVATSPITLTQADGSVAETTIYVRLKDNLAIGTYNQDISIVSDGATSQTVSCSGEVTTPAAPVAPVATAASVVGSDSFTANWNSVSGATGYRLDVYEKEVGDFASDLFFSEYIEGGGTNKALEIFNGTGAPVDLTAYKINLYSNSASTASATYSLTGSLADGDVFVAAHSSATSAFTSVANYTVNGGVVSFNGDDAVALLKNDVIIDVIGVIGTQEKWSVAGTANATENKTLVRKSSVQAGNTDWAAQAGTNADDSEWIVYAQDTSTYLGSHTFDGGSTLTYVTGFEDTDVTNVTSYEITGLDPETTYYYVVRVYDAYSQTSLNSNEIEVTTIAAITYDITPGIPATYGNEGAETSITITGGGFVGANIISEGLTPAANAAFITSSAGILQLIGTGSVTLSFTPAAGDTWFTYSISGGDWVVIDLSDPDTVPIEIIVNLGSKDAAFEFKSGTGGDPTLPVELSTFTVSLNAFNNAVLNWITQTETGVSGFYVYRNNSENLASAILVSNLIPATNSSEEHSYSFTDKELFSHGTYYYWLQVADIDGSESYHGPATLVYTGDNEPALPSIPTVTELRSIFPNPFNPNTNLSYSLAEEAEVSVKIYNARGQLVRTLNEGRKAVGHHSAAWDGKDDRGQNQSTGVYFFRMQAGKKVFNSKAVLMK